MSKKAPKPIIYAYGFDKCRFTLPSSPHETNECVVKFFAYESDCSFEEADGLIIPSGIFEEIYWENDYLGGREQKIRFDKAVLAAREKQLYNAFKSGVWTLFMLSAVDNGKYNDWTHTDLAKKLLNVFADNVTNHDPNPYLSCKADEFRKYLDRFGVAQTKFWVKDKKEPARVLADESDTPVALEIRGEFFFLPFFTTKREASDLTEALSLSVDAVLEYKRKNDIYVPAWLSTLEFQSEARLKLDIQRTQEQLVKLNEELGKWEKYKAILCTSGPNLNAIVVEVLRDFFGVNLKSEERYIEDAVIYDDRDRPIYVLEIKGVNGGIKREHINQVDSHRERLGLTAEIPGLFVVNDFMDVENFEERKLKAFDAQNLAHAKTNNVRILRTIMLFEMMLALENATDRKGAFFVACQDAAPLVKVS